MVTAMDLLFSKTRLLAKKFTVLTMNVFQKELSMLAELELMDTSRLSKARMLASTLTHLS